MHLMHLFDDFDDITKTDMMPAVFYLANSALEAEPFQTEGNTRPVGSCFEAL